MTTKTRKALEMVLTFFDEAVIAGTAAAKVEDFPATRDALLEIVVRKRASIELAITEALAEPAPLRLTDEELCDIYRAVSPGQIPASVRVYWPGLKAFARAIEARIFGDVK